MGSAYVSSILLLRSEFASQIYLVQAFGVLSVVESRENLQHRTKTLRG